MLGLLFPRVIDNRFRGQWLGFWLLIEFLGRRVVLGLYPIERTPGLASGSIVNLVLLAMLVLGLALSLWPRRNAAD